jgi:hypothetical protein
MQQTNRKVNMLKVFERIAAVMEEILRLVKEDQARTAAYLAKQKEEEDLD